MRGATYIGLYTITKPNDVYVIILQYAEFPMMHMEKTEIIIAIYKKVITAITTRRYFT